MDPLNAPSAHAVLRELERLLIAQARPPVTLKKLAADYLELHALPHKKTGRRDQVYVKHKILPAFGDVPISSIKRAEIQRWFLKLSESAPTTANRVLEVFSKMFECAIDWDYFGGPNPCKRIKPNPESKRERILSSEELHRLQSVLEQEPPAIAALFRLYLLTGCRKSELLYAQWRHLNIARRTLRLPCTKNGKPFDVPLSTEALTLLQGLPRASEYVFAGSRLGTVLAVDKAWRQIRSKAGISDVTIHDLRRTTASLLASLGVSHKTISHLLNHSSWASTERYVQSSEPAVMSACEALGHFFNGGPKQGV